MKLLVTGGLGFIGSNFILNTLQNNEEIQITNVDAEFYGSNQMNLSTVQNSKNYEFVKGNINDHELMNKLISKSDMASFTHTNLLLPECSPLDIRNCRLLSLIKSNGDFVPSDRAKFFLIPIKIKRGRY